MVLTCIKTVDNTGDLSLITLRNIYLTLYLSDIATKKVKKTLITKNTYKTKFKKRVWGGKDKSHVLLHFKVTLRFNISQPRATIKILSILIFDSNI